MSLIPRKKSGRGWSGNCEFSSLMPGFKILADIVMNNLKYKGYTGVVEFDGESGVLFGHVIGLRDVITFQGDSVAEVIQAFHDSVDVYLEFCSERGESPERPFSGQFVLRLDPNLHRTISHAAELQVRELERLDRGHAREDIRRPR